MIKITVNNKIRTISYKNSEDLEKELGSNYEYVYPIRLNPDFAMVVDVNGYQKDLDINLVGSYYYGSDKNGHAILGDILILRVHRKSDGYYFTDINKQEEKRLIEEVNTIIKNYISKGV